MATKKTTKPPAQAGATTKTGEVRFRDESGKLWVSESYVDEAGAVSTKSTPVAENQPQQGS